MSARVLVVSVLDPLGRIGLVPDVNAVHRAGAEAVPVQTGVLTGPLETPSLRALPAGAVERAVDEAFESAVDGMLVGIVPRYRQVRALARTLHTALPETLVVAPFSARLDPQLTLPKRARRLWRQRILPEATAVVVPAVHGAELLGEGGDEAAVIARGFVEAGAYASWLIGAPEHGRCIDTLALPDGPALLDYGRPETASDVCPAPALLAGLLALGMGLKEAVGEAHRTSVGSAADVFLASS